MWPALAKHYQVQCIFQLFPPRDQQIVQKCHQYLLLVHQLAATRIPSVHQKRGEEQNREEGEMAQTKLGGGRNSGESREEGEKKSWILGRREKLAQKVGRREIYLPVPPPSQKGLVTASYPSSCPIVCAPYSFLTARERKQYAWIIPCAPETAKNTEMFSGPFGPP